MSTDPQPVALEYASHNERRATPALYWISLACGVVPMVSGVGILLFYWLTSLRALVLAGLITLLAGGFAVLMGIALVCIYRYQARRATVDRTQSIHRGNKSLLILFLNFPVAFICCAAGISLVSHSPGRLAPVRSAPPPPPRPTVTFVLKNKGAIPVDESVVVIGSQSFSCGPVRPGIPMMTLAPIGTFSGQMSLILTRKNVQATTQLSNYVGTDSYPPPRRFEIEIDDNGAKLTSW